MTNSGHCGVCGEDIETAHLLDHLRLMHPDEYGDGPERWPDGGIVCIDTTLEPEDFQ